jgi:hypothetical protein
VGDCGSQFVDGTLSVTCLKTFEVQPVLPCEQTVEDVSLFLAFCIENLAFRVKSVENVYLLRDHCG